MEDVTEAGKGQPGDGEKTPTPRTDRFMQLLDEERKKDPDARPAEIARRALSRLHAERRQSTEQ